MSAVDYEQLAPFYDGLARSRDDVAFFARLARAAGGPVVELMAGTGRVSVLLAEQGVELTCVDASPAMLARLRAKLRERGLAATVVRQDVTRLDLPTRFALAFVAFHSFEELTGDADRARLMDAVHAHLTPGGRFACTLHDPELRRCDVGAPRRWRFPDPRTARTLQLVLSTTWDEERRVVHGREVVEDAETGAVLANLELRFRLSTADEFRDLARRRGFTVESLHGDDRGGEYRAGESPTMFWVLARDG